MSKRPATVGIVLIVVLVSAAAIVGGLYLPKLTAKQKVPVLGAPQDHWAIIENLQFIEIGETGDRFTLDPLCVDYGLKDFGKEWPLSAFTPGDQYPQSTWLFQRHGDTEACLTIWGPADDQGYDLEASRLVGFQKIEIWYDDELIRTMPMIQGSEIYTCMPGYVWFTLELEEPPPGLSWPWG